MTDTPTTTRTRFAPSPSGHLHVGGARTALYCYAFAKKHSGKFILRIEDTDQRRSSDAASLAFLEDLKWLGIEWDEGPEYNSCGGGEYGPYFQSRRLDLYNQFIEQLISEEKAYYAFDTAEELDAARDVAWQAGKNYSYDREKALAISPKEVQQRINAGEKPVVRFKTPHEDVTVHDQVLGDVTTPAGEIDDFVIRKADGYPTYHFAVVVDDQLMQVTHILRGQEHLKNTARHIYLQDGLKFRRPAYAHLSLIFNPDNSKMSKRDKDKALRHAMKTRELDEAPDHVLTTDRWAWWQESADNQLQFDEANVLAEFLQIDLPEINVDDFRRSGYLPAVLCNYLALLGWSTGDDTEQFDMQYLTEHFGIDRLHKSPAKFDRDKLLAFNLQAIQNLSTEEFTALYQQHCQQYHPDFIEKLNEQTFGVLAAANHSRAKTLDDTIESSRFFIMDDDAIVYEETKPVRKVLRNGEPNGLSHLKALRPVLSTISTWEANEIENVVQSYAQKHADGKLGKVAQPLRIAVSGGTISPAIFDTLEILGKKSVLARVERCLKEFDNC